MGCSPSQGAEPTGHKIIATATIITLSVILSLLDNPEKLDLAKKCIRQYFPSCKCFVFDRPASRRALEELEDLPESKLNPDFLEQVQHFCSYIHEQAQAKVIQGGHTVTGTCE